MKRYLDRHAFEEVDGLLSIFQNEFQKPAPAYRGVAPVEWLGRVEGDLNIVCTESLNYVAKRRVSSRISHGRE